MDIFQIYMVIFLLIYFGLNLGVRSILLYRKTKVNALKNFGNKPKVGKAERLILVALFLLIVVASNFIFLEANYHYLIPFEALEIPWLQTAGFVLSMLGLALGFVAQSQMKKSWRLGIDEESILSLKTEGLFSFSRNPIYFGLGMSSVGFFFIAPNLLSLIFLLLMFYGVNEKIKDEEKFLSTKFGSSYQIYKSKVRKWI